MDSMRIGTLFTIGVSALLLTGSSASAEVSLTIQGGRVTLVAKDATLRQILAEWARVGQTRIVNAERVPGGPLTLQLTNVPEEQALETLLRPLSGYVAAPRSTEAANLSRFDRILVMPTPAAPPPAAPASATTSPSTDPQPGTPTQSPPNVMQGAPSTQPQAGAADDQEDDRPATTIPPRGPVFNTFPQPQVVNPPQQSVPSTTPGVTPPAPAGAAPQPNAPVTPPPTYPGVPTVPYGGVSVPGMVAPPPQQPGQSPPNGAPPKRPGGRSD
jgi:hypothetical protein